MNIKIISDAFVRHQDLGSRTLDVVAADVEKAATLLAEAIKGNHCVFTCGNGGSAADSQHFSGEFLCRYRNDRRPLKAVSLTSDTSTLTAIGNDYQFDAVFSRPLKALGNAGDLLVAFTTSGTSKNVVAAMKQAKESGMKIIVFTGEGGAHLKDIVDAVIAVPSRETARIQEMHELIYHALCEHLDTALGLVQ